MAVSTPAKDLWAWFPAAVNPNVPRIGPAIASAATVAPTNPVHHITGAAAIVTITPPATDFQGEVIFISDGIFTWTAAGNIAIAGTSTAVGKQFKFLYDPATLKWYPDKIA